MDYFVLAIYMYTVSKQSLIVCVYVLLCFYVILCTTIYCVLLCDTMYYYVLLRTTACVGSVSVCMCYCVILCTTIYYCALLCYTMYHCVLLRKVSVYIGYARNGWFYIIVRIRRIDESLFCIHA